jgi:hypothetical protein
LNLVEQLLLASSLLALAELVKVFAISANPGADRSALPLARPEASLRVLSSARS